MKFKRKLISAAVAVALAGLVVGCGDSKKKHPVTDTGSTTEQSVSGVAVKGIFKNANVTINEIVNGTRNQLGTAVTDDQGNYEVSLDRGASSGILEIIVSPGTNSSIVCDVVDGCGSVPFGGSIAVAADSGLVMKAIVAASADQTTVNTAVSPLTNMAAARVEALGTFNEANINTAANEVLAITGIDVRTSVPIDITSEASLATASTAAKQQALYLAGLADLLITSDGSIDAGALDDLAESFSDGEFSNEDEISLGEILDAVENAAENVPSSIADDLTEAITAIENKVTAIKDDPNFSDDLEAHAQLTAVARAKALVGNTRAWLSAIKDFKEDFNDGSYESSVNLFFDEEAIKDTLDDDAQRAAQLSGEILNQTLDALELPVVRATLESGESYPVPIFNDSGDEVGTLDVRVDDTNGIAIILSGTLDAENNVVVNDLTLSSNLTLDSFNEDYTLFETFTSNAVNLLLTGSIVVGSSSLTFNSVAVDITATEDFTVGGDGQTSDEDAESIFDSMTLEGNIVISTNQGANSFNGLVALELDALQPDVVAESVLSLKSIDLEGAFTSPNGTFDIATSLLISNADRFDTFGFAEHDDVVYESIYVPGNQIGLNNETLADQIEEDLASGISGITVYYAEYDEFFDSTSLNMQVYFAADTLNDMYLYLDLPGDLTNADDSEILGSVVAEFEEGISDVSVNYADYDSSQDQTSAGAYASFVSDVIGNQFVNITLQGSYFSISQEDLLAQFQEETQLDVTGFDIEYAYYLSESDETYFSIAGFVPDFESEDYFLQGVLTVSTDIEVEGLPAADAIVSVGRTALNGAYAEINLSWEGERYLFAIEAPNLDGESEDRTATLTVTDQAGTAMILNLSEVNESVSGTVIVDGRQVGTISDSSGVPIVRYSDGNETSFESLF